MRIQVLPPLVANQIAAGEVIENPASVVKELLENALDAQASAVHIEIGFGGLNQILIADNGKGILAEDLPLAIAPHATSKLTSLEELAEISSMGFRGEALASIASVSRLTVTSKPKSQDLAMRLTAEGGVILHTQPCARNQGTTIEVRDLFFNANVRRRFLKAERSEYLAIEHVVKRFALSVPQIALQLKHNGKLMLELPAAVCEKTQRLRIQKLLGKSFIEASFAIEATHLGMHLKGLISTSGYQRSQNDRQWIYLNQRMVKDKLLFHAFRQAYENQLHPGRHPACILYLTMPSTDVDVNVHPTKHEVRFLQPRLVHDFVSEQISNALESIVSSPPSRVAPAFQLFEPTPIWNPDPADDNVQEEEVIQESYSLATSSRVATSNASFDSHWHILNSQFAILSVKTENFLIDMQRLNQAYHLTRIHDAKFPLQSRPLLVPIRIPWASALQDPLTLEEYGIAMHVTSENVTIRTIPVLFPQLNVKEFIQQVLSLKLQHQAILRCLVTAQYFDAYQLSSHEKKMLGDFALQQQESSPGWCLPFDRNRCQELFSV